MVRQTIIMLPSLTRVLTFIRAAVVFAVQSWLAETPESKKTSTTPGIFSVGMART